VRRVVASQARTAAVAFRRPSLRLLLASYFAYSLARKASRVALLVLAFDLGGVQATAGMAVAMLVPGVIVAPVGSALGDRISPVRALGLGYGAQAAALLATGVAVLLSAPLGIIALLASVTNAAYTLTRPVHQATLPDVAERPDELALGNAASVWADGVASLVGPLLAGLVLALAGAGEVLLILAAVCSAAALMSLRLVLKRDVRAPEPAPIRDVLLDGARELARDRDGAALTGLVALQYVVVGLLDVLLVVFVVEVLERPTAAASILAAAIGAGAALGAAVSVALSGRPRLGPALVVGAVLTGGPVALLVVTGRLGVVEFLLILYGAGKGLVTVAGQTLLQRTVREDVSARVFGIQEGLIQAATAIGSALGPVLVVSFGIQGALLATGAILPLVALAAIRALRRLDSRAVVPGPVFDLLNAVPFLSVLPLRTLERLSRSAGRSSVDAGLPVVRQGDPGDRYFVIEHGSARVEVSGAYARSLGPGDGFGEIALLEDSPRTATVTALADLALVWLERDEFLSALTSNAPALEGARWRASDRLRSDSRHRRG
jgi:predicted MFS family arabinose efflux permease